MGSLTSCIKKAGKAISSEDKTAIVKAAAKLREGGMSNADASMRAVEEQIAAIKALIVAAGGDPAESANVPKAKDKIQDFGEKLEGAEKDETPVFSRSGPAKNVLSALKQNDDLFQLPATDAKTVEQIAADIDPGLKVTSLKPEPGQKQRYRIETKDGRAAYLVVRAPNPYGPSIYGFDLVDREMVNKVEGLPGENTKAIPEGIEEVFIDASKLNRGSGGVKVYAIASALALNTDRLFIGDPAGLSDEALRRRSENMLSSALRYGTTEHLAPHPRQVEGDAKLGVPPLKWVYGDHVGNIERLIDVNLKALDNAGDGEDRTQFNPDNGLYQTGSGREVPGVSLAQAVADHPDGRAGTGGRTLARAAVWRALLRQRGSEGTGAGRGTSLLAELAKLGNDRPSAVEKLFSRGAGAGMQPEALRATVATLTKGWSNAPDVVVVSSMSDPAIPAAVRNENERQLSQGATGQPEGFFYGGKAYLVANQIGSEQDARRVLFHETLGHAGLRGTFGESLKGILGQVVAARPREVRAKVVEYGLSWNSKADRLIAAEEVLAEMAQSTPELGFVRRAVAAIRTWLRNAGLRLGLSNDEIIRDFILPARQFVTGRRAGAGGGVVFSRGTTSTMPEDKAPGPQGDAQGANSGKSVADQIAKAIEDAQDGDWWGASFGLRVIPPEYMGDSDVGAMLQNSFRWADGDWTKDELNGVSTVGIEQLTAAGISRALKRIDGPNAAGYLGTRVVLVAGESHEAGEDPGEYVIKNGTVLASWRRDGDWKSRIIPNEQSAPSSGGAPLLSQPDPIAESAMRKAGVGPRAGIKHRVGDAFGRALELLKNRKELADEAQQAGLDQFTGIKRAVERELGNLPAEQDPYVAARLANGGTSSVMRGILMHGQAQWAANGQHLEKKPDTKGLLQILEPLGNDLNDWFGWMIGNRAARLMTEGKENNFTADEIKALQSLGTPEKLAKFRAVSMEYTAFKRSVLDIAEQAGLIDPEGRKVWDRADWIPFYRQIDEKATFSATGKRGMAGQSSGIRTLKGGSAGLNDPMENLLMNFSRLIDASLKNNALRRTLEAFPEGKSAIFEKVGYQMTGQIVPAGQIKKQLIDSGTPQEIIGMIPQEVFDGMAKMWAIQAPQDPDVIRVMVGGKPQFYRVNDGLMLKALTSFIPFDFPGLGAMRAFKRLLTATVTSTPEFMVRNFIRDTVASQMIARDGINPAMSMKGIVDSYKESGAYEAMLFAGASFQGGQVSAADPTGTATAIRRSLRSKGMDAASIDAFMGTILDMGAKGWDKYRSLTDAVENANREAVYEAAMNTGKGATAAAYEAKDLMDFNLRGSSPVYQFFADVLPFFNARIQGMYRLYRADPKVFTLEAFKTKLVQYGLLMTAASVALAIANSGDDDDWYAQLPDWDKDTYWHFKIGGEHFRVPKPFELGVVFATIPERITRYVTGKDTGTKLAKRVYSNVRDQLAIDPVPQMFRPALDVYRNRDAFRDAPIENMGDQNKPDNMRYGPTTSATMRELANVAPKVTNFVGLSPKELEHLFTGYLGTVGSYGLALSDWAVRGIAGDPERPTMRADDIPVVKAFYRKDPARATVFESDLYDLREKLNKIHAGVKALEKEGKPEDAAKLRQDNARELAVRPIVERSADTLSRLRKQRNAVLESRTMTPDQKRVEVDRLQESINRLTQKTMQSEAVRGVQ